MKLLVVITIEEYSEQLRELLRKNKVKSYSETSVTNFKFFEGEDEINNWFGNHNTSMEGHLFFAFMKDERADLIIDTIAEYSKDFEGYDPIRVFKLDVEKFHI